jgi:hypothetical protein
MSRQTKYQQERIKRGLCSSCGAEPLVSRTLGAKCLLKKRKINLAAGHKPWSGIGRPPIDLEKRPRKR